MYFLLRVVGTLFLLSLTACGLQHHLDAQEALQVERRGHMPSIIRLNGHVCALPATVRLAYSPVGIRAYHVTCQCPASGAQRVMALTSERMPLVACTPGPLPYLVEANPLAPTGSPYAFFVYPALPLR